MISVWKCLQPVIPSLGNVFCSEGPDTPEPVKGNSHPLSFNRWAISVGSGCSTSKLMCFCDLYGYKVAKYFIRRCEVWSFRALGRQEPTFAQGNINLSAGPRFVIVIRRVTTTKISFQWLFYCCKCMMYHIYKSLSDLQISILAVLYLHMDLAKHSTLTCPSSLGSPV